MKKPLLSKSNKLINFRVFDGWKFVASIQAGITILCSHSGLAGCYVVSVYNCSPIDVTWYPRLEPLWSSETVRNHFEEMQVTPDTFRITNPYPVLMSKPWPVCIFPCYVCSYSQIRHKQISFLTKYNLLAIFVTFMCLFSVVTDFSVFRSFRLWGPRNLLFNGYWVFCWGKAAGAWCLPLSSV